jgi:hypothetical protein
MKKGVVTRRMNRQLHRGARLGLRLWAAIEILDQMSASHPISGRSRNHYVVAKHHC